MVFLIHPKYAGEVRQDDEQKLFYVNGNSYHYGYEQYVAAMDPEKKKQELEALDYDLHTLEGSDLRSYHIDYIIKKLPSQYEDNYYLVECSYCGTQFRTYYYSPDNPFLKSQLGHKIKECDEAKFKKRLERYKEQEHQQVKCISDRILLYLRYGLASLPFKDDTIRERFTNYTMSLYEKIRGNEVYLGKNPRGLAASIIYIAEIMTSFNTVKDYEKQFETIRYTKHYTVLNQNDIAKLLNVSVGNIRQLYKFIKETEKL